MAHTDTYIPTLAMTNDPRLRRLFALVGRALTDGDLFYTEEELERSLLDLAPEFLPDDDGEFSACTIQELRIS